MRVSLVLASLCVACGAAHAENATPPADQSGVVVNMDALPVPIPRAKPSPEAMRPLAQVRPRAKPAFETSAAEATEPATAVSIIPLPRAKPAMDVAALVPATAPVVRAHPVVEPGDQPAAPTPPPAAPVVIVSAPVTDTSIGVEISGVAQQTGPSKPINPIEGFAVLSRVRFQNGKTVIPEQAHATLDSLAQRLLTSRERVRLAAFSGKAGDGSSDARRLSLARALAIRAYLVSKGIAIDRVDVLAFGGATDGISDRVDVLVRGI